MREAEPRLSLALGAGYGPQVGHEATAEALEYAWENWDRVRSMDNSLGYLYRVGQSRARRLRRRYRRLPSLPSPQSDRVPWVEPALPAALADLSRNQRNAVVLVYGFEWTQQEVAGLLGVSRTTVQKHLERGLAKLRAALEEKTDV
jgi:DNA-directed RNA polymerase specialized sigma24 family protein